VSWELHRKKNSGDHKETEEDNDEDDEEDDDEDDEDDDEDEDDEEEEEDQDGTLKPNERRLWRGHSWVATTENDMLTESLRNEDASLQGEMNKLLLHLKVHQYAMDETGVNVERKSDTEEQKQEEKINVDNKVAANKELEDLLQEKDQKLKSLENELQQKNELLRSLEVSKLDLINKASAELNQLRNIINYLKSKTNSAVVSPQQK